MAEDYDWARERKFLLTVLKVMVAAVAALLVGGITALVSASAAQLLGLATGMVLLDWALRDTPFALELRPTRPVSSRQRRRSDALFGSVVLCIASLVAAFDTEGWVRNACVAVAAVLLLVGVWLAVRLRADRR